MKNLSFNLDQLSDAYFSFYKIKTSTEHQSKNKSFATDLKTIETIRNSLITDFELDRDSIEFLDFELGILSQIINSPSKSPETSTSDPFQRVKLDCLVCKKKFKSEKGLKQHIGKRHSETKPVVSCHICGKGFRHKYAVKFHVNQVHNKTTRVDCTLCGKEIYNKYMLADHLSKVHLKL